MTKNYYLSWKKQNIYLIKILQSFFHLQYCLLEAENEQQIYASHFVRHKNYKNDRNYASQVTCKNKQL